MAAYIQFLFALSFLFAVTSAAILGADDADLDANDVHDADANDVYDADAEAEVYDAAADTSEVNWSVNDLIAFSTSESVNALSHYPFRKPKHQLKRRCKSGYDGAADDHVDDHKKPKCDLADDLETPVLFDSDSTERFGCPMRCVKGVYWSCKDVCVRRRSGFNQLPAFFECITACLNRFAVCCRIRNNEN